MTAPDPTALAFVHRFEAATAADRPPLLVLHGTGGDESDLLPFGRTVAPGAALLSPRGPVLENGMPRFFRRLAEGVFDEDDVRRRAADLASFVAGARAAYGLPAPVALGFSNGANIAAAVLLLHPGVLAGAVLLRPMRPLAVLPEPDLTGLPVLMLSGAQDPIVPEANVRSLTDRLRASGARVEHTVLRVGHGLSQADVTTTQAWIARIARA
ncbi:alpha/beta hydrolase [Methylobacterium sp. J-090]|uniref:alpha/beta hydrolase n=1 Tax=Methylobacterium sp. J-090 TaxID=2836666 RepID=UPI001FBB59E1|nr:alpha/beta hydrolase [Methylobacterium sp. J-090]MCJ2081969.1 alpha/beta hydrolase [Methylobacterium sp. J-090]